MKEALDLEAIRERAGRGYANYAERYWAWHIDIPALIEEVEKLRKMLAKATVRLGILRDRMEACPAQYRDDSHGLSLFEIPAWIDEQQAALSASPSPVEEPIEFFTGDVKGLTVALDPPSPREGPTGLDMPCNGALTCPCRQCVRELGP